MRLVDNHNSFYGFTHSLPWSSRSRPVALFAFVVRLVPRRSRRAVPAPAPLRFQSLSPPKVVQASWRSAIGKNQTETISSGSHGKGKKDGKIIRNIWDFFWFTSSINGGLSSTPRLITGGYVWKCGYVWYSFNLWQFFLWGEGIYGKTAGFWVTISDKPS